MIDRVLLLRIITSAHLKTNNIYKNKSIKNVYKNTRFGYSKIIQAVKLFIIHNAAALLRHK